MAADTKTEMKRKQAKAKTDDLYKKQGALLKRTDKAHREICKLVAGRMERASEDGEFTLDRLSALTGIHQQGLIRFKVDYVKTERSKTKPTETRTIELANLLRLCDALGFEVTVKSKE